MFEFLSGAAGARIIPANLDGPLGVSGDVVNRRFLLWRDFRGDLGDFPRKARSPHFVDLLQDNADYVALILAVAFQIDDHAVTAFGGLHGPMYLILYGPERLRFSMEQ